MSFVCLQPKDSVENMIIKSLSYYNLHSELTETVGLHRITSHNAAAFMCQLSTRRASEIFFSEIIFEMLVTACRMQLLPVLQQHLDKLEENENVRQSFVTLNREIMHLEYDTEMFAVYRNQIIRRIVKYTNGLKNNH